MASRIVPFSAHTGHMESYPENRHVMRELTSFGANMRIVGMERGCSAARFILEDMDTGVRYPIFMADMVKLLEGATICGEWSPVKRGANYGITPDLVYSFREKGDE